MLDKIEDALEDLRAGKSIIVVDDENRENEGSPKGRGHSEGRVEQCKIDFFHEKPPREKIIFNFKKIIFVIFNSKISLYHSFLSR